MRKNPTDSVFILTRYSDDEMVIMGIFTTKEKAEIALSELDEFFKKAKKEGLMKYFSYPISMDRIDIEQIDLDTPNIHGIL